MIPNKNSYCEIDPERVDQWGIPVLRFHFHWSDAEINQVRHMHQTFASIIETMGGRVIGAGRPIRRRPAFRLAASSSTKRARCGWAAIPKTSALNKYCQAHEVKNLFVCDAAPFVSQPDKNVTLSIVAFRVAGVGISGGRNEEGQCLNRNVELASRGAMALVRSAAGVGIGGAGDRRCSRPSRRTRRAATAATSSEGADRARVCHAGESRGVVRARRTRERASAPFIDFLCHATDDMKVIFTGGLAWLDDAMRRRADGKDFMHRFAGRAEGAARSDRVSRE